MKQTPLLFSAPMVRALLAGTKTQTRRLVKGEALEWLRPDGFTPEFVAHPENGLSPCGYTGDRIWGREAWRTAPQLDAFPPRELASGAPLHFEADGRPDPASAGKLRPSMFMPRWACRLELDLVENPRIERLQAISEADCIAEGIYEWMAWLGRDPKISAADIDRFAAQHGVGPRGVYAALWESINGPGSWERDPWIWRYAVKRLEG